jgi:uncharacterized protein
MLEPYRYYTLLIVGWIGAWLLYETAALGALSPYQVFAYWTTAKVIVWITPIVLIVRVIWRRPILEYLGLVRGRRGVRVGLVVGAIFVALAASLDAFTRSYAWPSMGPGLVNALAIAPLFEEVMFRGFALRALQERGCRFWTANVIAALMFLGLHLPGWYFMGGLGPSQALVGVSVVLIGLVAGYAARRAQSTWAAVVVHGLNNLYAAFLR